MPKPEETSSPVNVTSATERCTTPVTVTHFSSDKNGLVEKIILASPPLSNSKKITNLTLTEFNFSNDLISLDPLPQPKTSNMGAVSPVSLTPLLHSPTSPASPEKAEERLSELVSSNPFGNPFKPDPLATINPFQNNGKSGLNPFLESLVNPFSVSSPQNKDENLQMEEKNSDSGHKPISPTMKVSCLCASYVQYMYRRNLAEKLRMACGLVLVSPVTAAP